MSTDPSSPSPTGDGAKLPYWLVIVIFVGLLGFGWWKNSPPGDGSGSSSTSNSPSPISTAATDNKRSGPVPDENEPNLAETSPEYGETSRDAAPLPPSSADHRSKGPLPGPLSNHRDRNQVARSSTQAVPEDSAKHQISNHSDESTFKVENQKIRDLHGNIVFKGMIDLKPTIDRIEKGESNRHRNDGTSFQNREGHLPRKPSGYYKEYVHPTPGENGPGPQRIIIGKDGDIWYTPDHYKTFKNIKAESN